MRGRLIEEDLFTKYSIVDSRTPEGQEIHEFLATRARALAGKYIDFDKMPVTFVLSDSDEPNAFYAPAPDPEYDPHRGDDTVRYLRNPLDTPVICITRGLIEMADNLDQLDFVLGHELTHMIMRLHKIRDNSKGEEEISDVHSVDLMYDAGSDPKQALVMSEKLNAWAAAERKKRKRKRRLSARSKQQEEQGINWSEILEVHMTAGNRNAGIEAALTRLSHLIDDREPTVFDKSVFAPRYSDPVDAFLNAHGYETKKSIGKLRILVDCIAHLAEPVPADVYVRQTLATLPASDAHGFSRAAKRREALQKTVEDDYAGYFPGPLIDKRYQQKMASMAEAAIKEVEIARRGKGNPDKPAEVNTQDLQQYLLNEAYRHINAHGYPKQDDFNYLDASGIMYSYFHCLFDNYSPRDDDQAARKLPQIKADIQAVRDRMRAVQTVEEFMAEAAELNRLGDVWNDIKDTSFGQNGDKLDNLSSISDFILRRMRNENPAYDALQPGGTIPWNNLVEIAKTSDQAKEVIVAFLQQNGIEDFRITHGLPYIRINNYQCWRVEDDIRISNEEVQAYELDFAIKRDLVLQAYDYIKAYFDDEEEFIDARCASIVAIDDADFRKKEKPTDAFNDHTLAHKKIYDFISVFNALPDRDPKMRERDGNMATSLIPERHQADNPIPGSSLSRAGFRDRMIFEYSQDLFKFDNPIFQDHFGADFEEKLLARKAALQSKMFDAAFAFLEHAVDIWMDARPQLDDLKARRSALWDMIWHSENKAEVARKRKEEKALEPDLNFQAARVDQTHTVIYNMLNSIFSKEKHWYHLQRLTPDQNKLLAEYAVKDEKGAILTLCEAAGYELYCDYLGILTAQTERVIAGDDTITPWMRVVADRYGYQHAETREALTDFATKRATLSRYDSDNQQYAWYLHILDTMRHLKKTPEIDVFALAIALSRIEQSERSSVGSVPHDIAEIRYKNYHRLIAKSALLPLAVRAIDHQDNYQGLSCHELLKTADALIEVRLQLAKLLGDRGRDDFSENPKAGPNSDQFKFMDMIDKNIRGLLRKASHEALQQDDALTKMRLLYGVYHQEQEHTYSTENRKRYLEPLIKNERRLKQLASMSADAAFWPEDTLDHAKAFAFAKHTFLDDAQQADMVLNTILAKLEIMPAGKKKTECLFILLDKNLRAAYPETRERLFAVYTADVLGKLGKDDGSELYQKRLSAYLSALASDKKKDWDIGEQHGQRDGLLANGMATADKYQLMRHLSDAIVSQEKTSQMIKESCQIKLNSKDMVKSYLYGIGVDYLTEEMDRDPDMARKFIEFLNSRGEQSDCETISTSIETAAKGKYKKLYQSGHLQEILENTRPSNCKIFYENFWSAPLEARAVIIARVLKSAVEKKKGEIEPQPHSWEQAFDLVMDNLIDTEDTSIEARYAREIMHSYIKSRSDYERVLIMSAMMVANRNIGNDKGNIGKALKLFLENMGPAEIKLGQAIASHPNTPESIASELQKLKSVADMPARWALYDWIKAENIPEQFWKNRYLGAILGSASYYTTIALGEDKVLRILRPEAREKAAKGFRVIRDTVDDLKGKEASSDLSYAELTASVQEMILQAARMAEIETDHEIGEAQCDYAKDIYNGVTIECDGEAFSLKVMDWRARGNNWIIMDRAKGLTYNDLPEDTPEQIAYKKRFAKAYIVFELTTILSGKKFDHDKHGAQLSIDPETNNAGIYDTGAMALHDPSEEEQRALGHVLHDVLRASLSGQDTFIMMNQSISRKIDELHQNDADTRYLVEVKKALLALGDFFKILDQDDIKDILPSIDLMTVASPAIMDGIKEPMSSFEKAQFHSLLTMQSMRGKSAITIRRQQIEQDPSQIIVVDIAVAKRHKAIWLQDAFSNPDDAEHKADPDDDDPANDNGGGQTFIWAAQGGSYGTRTLTMK